MSMDITETLAPKSDQLNADDLMTGPRTVTVTGVSRGDTDQPVNITTAEFGDGRPFKPCKSMRRVLAALWGSDAHAYVGRRMTLYRDEKVKFGGQEVGGIRIASMSHIEKRTTLQLTATRGKRAPFVVDPLPDAPPSAATAAGPSLSERVDKMLGAFAGIGVTQARLEAKLGRPRAEWGADDVASMQGVFMAVKGSAEAVAEAFPDASAARPGYATADQLAKLTEIRRAEKYEDDASWYDYVFAASTARVDRDADLTTEQADVIISIFEADNQ